MQSHVGYVNNFQLIDLWEITSLGRLPSLLSLLLANLFLLLFFFLLPVLFLQKVNILSAGENSWCFQLSFWCLGRNLRWCFGIFKMHWRTLTGLQTATAKPPHNAPMPVTLCRGMSVGKVKARGRGGHNTTCQIHRLEFLMSYIFAVRGLLGTSLLFQEWVSFVKIKWSSTLLNSCLTARWRENWHIYPVFTTEGCVGFIVRYQLSTVNRVAFTARLKASLE